MSSWSGLSGQRPGISPAPLTSLEELLQPSVSFASMDYLGYSDLMFYYEVDCAIVTNSQSEERWWIRGHEFLDVYTRPSSKGVILEAH